MEFLVEVRTLRRIARSTQPEAVSYPGSLVGSYWEGLGLETPSSYLESLALAVQWEGRGGGSNLGRG